MSTQPVDVPRDPSAFRPSTHFAERFNDRYEDDLPPRHLDGDIVSGCIQNGTVTKDKRHIYFFRETFGGVTYRIVVNVANGKVLTGYPIGINTEAATRSDRWTSTQIDDIHEFVSTDPR